MTTRRPGVPARVTWAVGLLDPRPDDTVLEVGGGPGVAAALVCDRLTTGCLLEVDRSAVALERTARRAAAHVAAGRLRLVRSTLAAAPLETASVDRAFAVDVNLFWTTDAAVELAVLARVLRPGAPLLLLYGTGGPTAPDRVLGPVTDAVAGGGFTDVRTVAGAHGCGVTARRPGPPASGRLGP